MHYKFALEYIKIYIKIHTKITPTSKVFIISHVWQITITDLRKSKLHVVY